MPQIQYPGYTNPPAFTPPTTDALGWRGSRPDVVQYAVRGRTPPGRLPAHLQTTGATVFAVEQWALPAPLVAKAYVPDNPQQFIKRNDSRARGGGYLNTTWTAYDFDPEDWALPKPLVARAYVPDSTRRAALTTGQLPFFFPDPRTPTAQTGTDWMTAWPDRIIGRAPRLWVMPAAFRGETIEQAAPTLLWSVTAPDTTRRAALQTTQHPALSLTLALEQAAPTLQWRTVAPDTTRRALRGNVGPTWISDPTTPAGPVIFDWFGSKPDNPTRVRPRQSQHVTLFAVENFPIPSQMIGTAYVPTNPRQLLVRALLTAELPSNFRGQSFEQFAATLLWTATYPATTRRAALAPAAMPSFTHPDTNFAPAVPTILRSIFPDGTRRLRLTVAVMQQAAGYTFPLSNLDKIKDRRHDDQTDRAGSRSPTSRMQGI